MFPRPRAAMVSRPLFTSRLCEVDAEKLALPERVGHRDEVAPVAAAELEDAGSSRAEPA